jgi:hypothetical protein
MTAKTGRRGCPAIRQSDMDKALDDFYAADRLVEELAAGVLWDRVPTPPALQRRAKRILAAQRKQIDFNEMMDGEQ